MKRTKHMLAAVSSVALVALSTAPAYAAGTTAGDSITNTVFVDYQVGGFDQTQETDTDTFIVDRRVNVTVAAVSASRTDVSPNQTDAVIEFDVTNLSNDIIDLELTTALGGSNDFVLSGVTIYEDNGDGVFDAATDTVVTYLDEMAEDETRTVWVVSDIPITADAGDIADVILTADAHAGGGAAALGTELTATAGANTAGIDTVLFDGAGDTDSANQGDFSDTNGYVVVAADVTVAKTSRIVSDPVNGTTNPKAIPGATVEYCIAVSNGAGAATATGVDVLDELPDDVTFVASSIFIDGEVDGSDNCIVTGAGSGVAGGTYTPGTPNEVSGTLSDIAAGVTRTLYFQATIN